MIEDFFKIGANLKKIPRRGWQTKLGIAHPESVADHSFSLALISMIISDIEGYDTKKILKMSLLHDLAESVVGDFTPDEISIEEKSNLENKAMNDILEKLPDSLKNEYSDIWKEYQENKNQESKFVHDVDKLEMALQAKLYQNEGIDIKKTNIFVDNAKESIKDPKLQKILSKILG